MSKPEIKKVQKNAQGGYVINESIILQNVEFSNMEFIYDLEYDDKQYTEEEAIAIAEQFLREALIDMMMKSEKIEE